MHGKYLIAMQSLIKKVSDYVKSPLLEQAFKQERLEYALNHAIEKGININLVKKMCEPNYRRKVACLILSGDYEIEPPKIAEIPKGNGEYREVYVNAPLDRIVLSLLADTISDVFSDMVHPCCRSYQRGLGTQETVNDISKKWKSLNAQGHVHIGYKSDFSKYFDSVKIEFIDEIFDEWERRLGCDKGTEPCINLIRKYYHQDVYFDKNENVKFKYQSLKQGCAIASPLANMILYDLDEYMSNKYYAYYRYSDDCIVIGKDVEEVANDINRISSKYGVTLNPKKVQPIYADEWVKFLGFNIKGGLITLSKSRIKNFQHEVENRTIKAHASYKKAKRSIYNYLYKGDHSWASGCFGTINVQADIEQMSLFVMDCLKACKYYQGKNKTIKLGGLGSDLTKGECTISRGKGKNVRTIRNVELDENYIGLTALWKAYNYNKALFTAMI